MEFNELSKPFIGLGKTDAKQNEQLLSEGIEDTNELTFASLINLIRYYLITDKRLLIFCSAPSDVSCTK